MKTSARGVALLKEFEGCRLKAYRDSVGVLTIGYGHTSAAGAPAVTAGLTISQAEAEAILVRDLAKYEAGVLNAVKVPLKQHQFDALVSFHYNTGAIGKATLTRKLNLGMYDAVPVELAKWNKAGGKVLAGLTRRRKAEADLWNEGASPVRQPDDPGVPEPAKQPATEPADSWLMALVKALLNLFRR
jgi:lysozyme